MGNFIIGIVSLTISAVVMSGVLIRTVKDTDTATGGTCWYANGTSYSCAWSTAEIALYGLITIAGIAGLVYGCLSIFGLA